MVTSRPARSGSPSSAAGSFGSSGRAGTTVGAAQAPRSTAVMMIRLKNVIRFISVVIPVYNKGPHIQRSISSVLSQTYKNFELILINDASTDNSLAEIKEFHDSRIRFFERTEPGPGVLYLICSLNFNTN